jgi:uncharacterized BrkB/YihY/UPF0761 family membrane protein
MAALVTGVNVARDQTEPKSFVKKRSKALALTFGAVVLPVVMLFLIAPVPSTLTHAGPRYRRAGRVQHPALSAARDARSRPSPPLLRSWGSAADVSRR